MLYKTDRLTSVNSIFKKIESHISSDHIFIIHLICMLPGFFTSYICL